MVKAGNRQAASQMVKELLKRYPESADVWYLPGYLHTDPAKKSAAYETALDVNPQHQMARDALAKLQ